MASLEAFGQVAFEMLAGHNNAQVRVARLNEHHLATGRGRKRSAARRCDANQALKTYAHLWNPDGLVTLGRSTGPALVCTFSTYPVGTPKPST